MNYQIVRYVVPLSFSTLLVWLSWADVSISSSFLSFFTVSLPFFLDNDLSSVDKGVCRKSIYLLNRQILETRSALFGVILSSYFKVWFESARSYEFPSSIAYETFFFSKELSDCLVLVSFTLCLCDDSVSMLNLLCSVVWLFLLS